MAVYRTMDRKAERELNRPGGAMRAATAAPTSTPQSAERKPFAPSAASPKAETDAASAPDGDWEAATPKADAKGKKPVPLPLSEAAEVRW